MRILLLIGLALAGCAEHPAPPQPQGRLIPVDPSSTADYRGNELYPDMVRSPR